MRSPAGPDELIIENFIASQNVLPALFERVPLVCTRRRRVGAAAKQFRFFSH